MSNVQSWAETFAPIHAHNKAVVEYNTWGHLYPQKNVSYKGKILFCVSGYGYTGTAIIDSKFEGLQDSPALYDTMVEYIRKVDNDLKDGVYLIDCTLRNYRFYGSPKLIYALD